MHECLFFLSHVSCHSIRSADMQGIAAVIFSGPGKFGSNCGVRAYTDRIALLEHKHHHNQDSLRPCHYEGQICFNNLNFDFKIYSNFQDLLTST